VSEPSSTAGPTSGQGGPNQSGAPQSQEAAPGEIDLEALAEKVMRLMKNEAQLERERLGRRPLR